MLTEGHEMTEEKMRNISKKMFIGGFFFLPWLWLVHILLFLREWRKSTTPADVKWYLKYSLVGCIVYTSIFVIWLSVYVTQHNKWGAAGDAIALIIPLGR
eukprot:TRINITY_DN8716_c0_g1_i2.p1 TRINITY_DN8716_c0_g1~~TRINITY_DN8716_c0_g1_i2.p1  ORF type:complete len:100 (-),score=18.33 TRINITY_DN8716_c0_g1_i2:77-376(-)